ncbi:hypothetical protein RWH45_15035 [Microbacterium sp. KSW4-17]|uniref:DUF732 domain-containing protein n=1 Tax=Microbacterium galbum TaxID=3075994 RepID=A0ABU3TAY5_9MICO|nr:hypothetical protein [Microbacterium sp. KSW4-17]MDU0368526.1 hypothetical protein [Microbacterium sp. KSW4-17]
MSRRRLLVALVVVAAVVSAGVEYTETVAAPRYRLATRAADPDGFLDAVRAAAPHGGVVAMSRDEDVLAGAWQYCVDHTDLNPGEPIVITVGGRLLTDGEEIGAVVRAARTSLC